MTRNKDELNFIHDMIVALDCKAEKIEESIVSIDKTLAVQEASLREHIRRTELLEDVSRTLENRSNMVIGAIGFMTLIATLATIYSVVR